MFNRIFEDILSPVKSTRENWQEKEINKTKFETLSKKMDISQLTLESTRTSRVPK